MLISVDMTRMADGRAEVRGRGTVDGRTAVSGKLELEYFNLRDRDAALRERDDRIVEHLRRRFETLNACGFKPGRQQ